MSYGYCIIDSKQAKIKSFFTKDGFLVENGDSNGEVGY